MIFVASVLATFWAWEFIDAYADWLPGYMAYFLVPLIACGMFFLPHVILFALAAAAVVGLLHRLTRLLNRSTQATQISRSVRRSNIPPPPH